VVIAEPYPQAGRTHNFVGAGQSKEGV